MASKCMAETLHCPPETIITLLISYTPNIKWKVKIMAKYFPELRKHYSRQSKINKNKFMHRFMHLLVTLYTKDKDKITKATTQMVYKRISVSTTNSFLNIFNVLENHHRSKDTIYG